MRTLVLTTAVLLIAWAPAHAQLNTHLLDDFDRADANTLGMTPTSPTSLQWSESGEAVGSGSSLLASETIRIDGNRADFQAGQKAGVKIATVDMSNVSGYPTTLSDASGVVTWAFNVRQSKSNPGGFGSTGEGGALFALAASGSDLDGTNAFAVILGDGDDTDAVKLVNYNGGYSANGDFTKIVEGTADRANEYVSVKVTYDNSTSPDTWTLYATSDPSDFPTTDPRTLDDGDLVGQVQQDFSGTSNGRKIIGALWDHGASTENALFDDIYVTDPGGQLPVELASFDVTSSGTNARLQWRTASETNNAGFEVQQKRDGTFETVDFVDGAGTTAEPQSYALTLHDLAPGRHTFRLRQVDLDGSAHLGPTRRVVVSSSRSGLTQTSANPVTGPTAQFQLSLTEPRSVTVRLVNVLGRTVQTIRDGRVPAGGASLSVDTEGLTSGTYFLRATGPGLSSTTKFTVIR